MAIPGLSAAAGLLPSIIGSKQVGPAAPVFQPGASGGVAGLLSNTMNQQAQQNNFGQGFQPLDNLAKLTGPMPPVDTTSDEAAPAEPESPGGFSGFLNNAFGNVDANLQSPSKVLGLGLLSSIDPRLAQGGLLASALFGPNKLL